MQICTLAKCDGKGSSAYFVENRATDRLKNSDCVLGGMTTQGSPLREACYLEQTEGAWILFVCWLVA